VPATASPATPLSANVQSAASSIAPASAQSSAAAAANSIPPTAAAYLPAVEISDKDRKELYKPREILMVPRVQSQQPDEPMPMEIDSSKLSLLPLSASTAKSSSAAVSSFSEPAVSPKPAAPEEKPASAPATSQPRPTSSRSSKAQAMHKIINWNADQTSNTAASVDAKMLASISSAEKSESAQKKSETPSSSAAPAPSSSPKNTIGQNSAAMSSPCEQDIKSSRDDTVT